MGVSLPQRRRAMASNGEAVGPPSGGSEGSRVLPMPDGSVASVLLNICLFCGKRRRACEPCFGGQDPAAGLAAENARLRREVTRLQQQQADRRAQGAEEDLRGQIERGKGRRRSPTAAAASPEASKSPTGAGGDEGANRPQSPERPDPGTSAKKGGNRAGPSGCKRKPRPTGTNCVPLGSNPGEGLGANTNRGDRGEKRRSRSPRRSPSKDSRGRSSKDCA